MELTYCDQWRSLEKGAFNYFDVDTARQHHNNKEPYTVLIKENAALKYIVTISAFTVSVSFADDDGLFYLTYRFHIKENDDIFLKMAYHCTYGDDGSMLDKTIFNFEESGELFMAKKDFVNGRKEEKKLQTDVSSNWDKFPKFGEYTHLLKEERE
jgi:hypothetical protein